MESNLDSGKKMNEEKSDMEPEQEQETLAPSWKKTQ